MKLNLKKYLPSFIRNNKRTRKILTILLVLFCIPILAVLILSLLVRLEVFGKLADKEELAEVKNPLASEVYSVDSVLLGKYFICLLYTSPSPRD